MVEISTLSWDQEKVRNAKVSANAPSTKANKRGDWLKSWLMLNDFVSPKGKEKQIDYILTKRRYLRNVKDAEANDMIHMGSDHRCVMATLLINMPEKKSMSGEGTQNHVTNVYSEHEEKAKENNMEMSELEKRCQDIIVTIKKSRRQKRKRST